MEKTTSPLKLVIMAVGLTFLSNFSMVAQTSPESISTEQQSEAKKTLMLEVKGMSCQLGCADGLDKTFKDTKGILKSTTTYESSSSEITYDPRLVTEKEIIKIIKKKGFTTAVIDNH